MKARSLLETVVMPVMVRNNKAAENTMEINKYDCRVVYDRILVLELLHPHVF